MAFEIQAFLQTPEGCVLNTLRPQGSIGKIISSAHFTRNLEPRKKKKLLMDPEENKAVESATLRVCKICLQVYILFYVK